MGTYEKCPDCSVGTLFASDVVSQEPEASFFYAFELAPEPGLLVAEPGEDFACQFDVGFADFGIGVFEVACGRSRQTLLEFGA